MALIRKKTSEQRALVAPERAAKAANKQRQREQNPKSSSGNSLGMPPEPVKWLKNNKGGSRRAARSGNSKKAGP